MIICREFMLNPFHLTGNDKALKTQIFLDRQLGNLVQINLVRHILQRFSSSDSGI